MDGSAFGISNTLTPPGRVALFNFLDRNRTAGRKYGGGEFAFPAHRLVQVLLDVIQYSTLTVTPCSNNRARVIHVSSFDGTQGGARFDVKAECDGFYNLLASHGSLIAFGADVERHGAHVVDVSGGTVRLVLGPGVTRVVSSAPLFATLIDSFLIASDCGTHGFHRSLSLGDRW